MPSSSIPKDFRDYYFSIVFQRFSADSQVTNCPPRDQEDKATKFQELGAKVFLK